MDLKQYIEEGCMKASVFARKLGISHATIHNIMNKKHDVTLGIAFKIVKFTKGKVKYEDLMVDSVRRKTNKNNVSKKNGESCNDHCD